MKRTYRLDRLYFKFLKPKKIPISQLPFLVSKLYEAGFIEVFHDQLDPGLERYSESEKILNGLNKKELFKLIEELI